MKHKKIICMMAVFSILAGISSITSHATEADKELLQEEQLAGDEYVIVENKDTFRSKDTSCCLTVETMCPEDFGLNTYVMLLDETGTAYRISINHENHYVGKIFLAPGKYQVTEVAVFNDYKQEYPFVLAVNEVTLRENDNQSISFVLRDYEKIRSEIEGTIGKESLNEKNLDIQLYETGLEGVKVQGTGTLVYDVKHHGEGAGTMEISGNAKGTYDVVVKMIKEGVLGEAVFQISLDGGKSFIGQDIVSASSYIGDAGLSLSFKTNEDIEQFAKGDEFHAKVQETFPVIASKESSATIIASGHPMGDYDFVLTILSKGGLGKSKFTLESTKGTMDNITDVIPENGVYKLKDDISLIFSDSTDYERDMTFNVTVRSNDTSINYTPIYVLFGTAVVGIVSMIAFIGSKKETDATYRIREYEWKKAEKEYER